MGHMQLAALAQSGGTWGGEILAFHWSPISCSVLLPAGDASLQVLLGHIWRGEVDCGSLKTGPGE